MGKIRLNCKKERINRIETMAVLDGFWFNFQKGKSELYFDLKNQKINSS